MPRRPIGIVLALGLAGVAAAAEAPFAPAGRTPEGDFDVTIELEVEARSRVSGRILLVRPEAGPSVGIDLGGGRARLFAGDARRPGARAGGPALGAGRHVLVARLRNGPEGIASLSLEADGRLADAICVDAAQGKDAAGAAYGTEALSGARVLGTSARRAEEAFFDDEFTWDEDEKGSWRPGSGCWDLATTRDAWVAVDKGPFATSSYRARPADGGTALSIADTQPVGRVHVSVAALVPEGNEAGIVFSSAARDDKPAWGALLVKPGPDGTGSARLVIAEGDELRDTAAPAAAYARPGAWTRLEVWSDWDWVRAAVGGRVVLEAATADLPAGNVGLAALGAGAVLFDDFHVRPWHVVRERAPGERFAWSRRGRVDGAAFLVAPEGSWRARDFRLELRGARGGPAPLPVPVFDGKPAEVCWKGVAWERASSLTLDTRGAHVMTCVDGRPAGGSVLDRLDAPLPGILTAPGAARAAVMLEPSMRPLEVDLFSSDFSVPAVTLPYGRGVVRVVGDRLRPTAGRWRCVREGSRARAGDQTGALDCEAPGLGAIWLARPSPGDVRVEVDLVFDEEAAFNQAGVVVSGDPEGGARAPRYTFALEHTTPGDKGFPPADAPRPPARLVLRATAVEVASAPLAPAPGGADDRGGLLADAPAASEAQGRRAVRLALERRGGALVGYVDGEPALAWRDPEPLRGDGVGLFVTGGRATFDRARFRHLRATASDFWKVEPAWQPLSGRWLAHTGLACIPWDHWITAFGSPGKAACLGLLREPLLDPCVVAHVSEAGEGFETRTHVHYPMHDVSVALRARLDAPRASGYRFLVAPLPDKSRVVLLREGVEVASSGAFRIVMADHCNYPREFTVVARAEGPRVRCEIDGREVIDWTDPQPLPAGSVVLGSEKGRVNFADVSVMDVSPGAPE